MEGIHPILDLLRPLFSPIPLFFPPSLSLRLSCSPPFPLRSAVLAFSPVLWRLLGFFCVLPTLLPSPPSHSRLMRDLAPAGAPQPHLVPLLSPCPERHPVMLGRERSLLLPQTPSRPPSFWSRGVSAPGSAHPRPPTKPFPLTRLPTPQKPPPCPQPLAPIPPTGQATSPGASWRPNPHKSKLCRSVVSNILCKKVFPGSTEGWRILLRGTLLIIRSQPNLLQLFFIPGSKPDYFPPSADLPLLKKKAKGSEKKIALVFAQQFLKRNLFLEFCSGAAEESGAHDGVSSGPMEGSLLVVTWAGLWGLG